MVCFTTDNIIAAAAGSVLVGETLGFGVLRNCMRLTGPAPDRKAFEDVVVCGAGAAAVCAFAELAAGPRGPKLWQVS